RGHARRLSEPSRPQGRGRPARADARPAPRAGLRNAQPLDRTRMSTPIQNLFNLEGKIALVTGGSRGLGLQIAEALGEAGAKILLTSRKAADLEEAAGDLQAKGIDTRWVAADASDPAQVERVVSEAMQRMGQIDILVNNAGASWGAPAEDHPLEAWDKVMNLNVRSIFVFSQQVARASMI